MVLDEIKLQEALRLGKEVAETLGLDGNQKIIAINNYARKVTGYDTLELLCLNDPDQTLFTPTELGESLEKPLSAQKINEKLRDLGLQKCFKALNNHKVWEPTIKGKHFSSVVDTGKFYGDDTEIKQLKWKQKVLELL